jgi:hypothetical protein
VVRGASGATSSKLFERQGALVSRALRIAVGTLKFDKSLSRGWHRQLTDVRSRHSGRDKSAETEDRTPRRPPR